MESNIFSDGKKATIIAALATILFASAKWIVGSISGSIVLVADAIHSFADSVSTILAWLGLRIAQKKPSKKFPYGYYKAENITALIISSLIFFAGFSIVKESVSSLISKSVGLSIPLLSVAVAFFDALVMFSVGTYEFKVGKRINSQSLMADGKESRMHIFSSLIVMAGLFSSWIGVPYIEGVAGIIISLFVFEVAFESFKDSAFSLMDISPSKEYESKVKSIIGKIEGVEKVREVKLRKSGPLIFGEARIVVREGISSERVLEIINLAEKEVKRKVKEIDSISIIISANEKKEWKLAIPLENNDGINSIVSSHFGRAKFFLFAVIKKNKLANWNIVENPFKGKDVRAGLAVAEFLAKKKINAVCVKEIGNTSIHALRDNLINVFRVSSKEAKGVASDFIEGRAEKLTKPTKEKI